MLDDDAEVLTAFPCSQVRQGIASNTKGTAFIVYEDVMDAKQACDKLNGYNFQNRYLVGAFESLPPTHADSGACLDTCPMTRMVSTDVMGNPL